MDRRLPAQRRGKKATNRTRELQMFRDEVSNQFQKYERLLQWIKKLLTQKIEDTYLEAINKTLPALLHKRLGELVNSDFQERGSNTSERLSIKPAEDNPPPPLAMIRIPNPGEFAVSSCGSPLLVTRSNCDNSANINIPLSNGKKIVILPHPEVDAEMIKGNLDANVMRQLDTLNKTLSEILGNF